MKNFKFYLKEDLVDVKYGKLTQEDEQKIDESDKIISQFKKNGILQKYKNMKMPSPNETAEEIKELKQIMANATDDDLLFAINAEVNEEKMYFDFAKSHGLHLPPDFIRNIFDQTDPILFYLKKYHNRARPEQFAAANNIPFQVEIASNALHPACPSGHALDSFLMDHFLSKMIKNKRKEISDFCEKMRMSRVHVGLHYLSDNEMSRILAKDLIESKLIEI